MLLRSVLGVVEKYLPQNLKGLFSLALHSICNSLFNLANLNQCSNIENSQLHGFVARVLVFSRTSEQLEAIVSDAERILRCDISDNDVPTLRVCVRGLYHHCELAKQQLSTEFTREKIQRLENTIKSLQQKCDYNPSYMFSEDHSKHLDAMTNHHASILIPTSF